MVRFSRCRQSYLEPGQVCMNQNELNSYFNEPKGIKVLYSRTYVDFEDIEQPLKSILRGGDSFYDIESEDRSIKRYTLSTHEFRDSSFIFEFFSDPENHEFFNLEAIENIGEFVDPSTDYFFQAIIARSDTKVVEIRRVVSFMQYLGDVGGVY